MLSNCGAACRSCQAENSNAQLQDCPPLRLLNLCTGKHRSLLLSGYTSSLLLPYSTSYQQLHSLSIPYCQDIILPDGLITHWLNGLSDDYTGINNASGTICITYPDPQTLSEHSSGLQSHSSPPSNSSKTSYPLQQPTTVVTDEDREADEAEVSQKLTFI
jgi:hypothetical protein